MAQKITAEQRGIAAAHEAGMHDKRPTPATCAGCRELIQLDERVTRTFKIAMSPAPAPLKGGHQSTRMLKVTCACGCIVRMTQLWITQAGLPTCGCGKQMEKAA